MVAIVDEIIDEVRSIIIVSMMLLTLFILYQIYLYLYNLYMICSIHKGQIKYVCISQSYNYLPLCSSCYQQHSKLRKHPQIIPLSKAIIQAQYNIGRQKTIVKQLQQPHILRSTLVDRLKIQLNQLQVQRQRLKRQIDKMINEEIDRLKKHNPHFDKISQWKSSDIHNNIKKKLIQIQTIQRGFKDEPQSLRKALNLQVKQFVDEITQHNKQYYTSQDFKLYSSTNHHFIFNKLSMISSNANVKPVRKVMNQSPLYFLIDQHHNTSEQLFVFNNLKQSINIYNVQEQNWQRYHIKDQSLYINSQGYGIYDSISQRFFYIGGINSNQKVSNKILMFDYSDQILNDQRWKEVSSLKIARSMCMATIVKYKNKDNKMIYGILIAGGKNGQDQVQKSCQFLNLQNLQISLFSQMNFGSFYGCLATYNDSTVIRVGGLNKNKNDYTVVQIVEKVDCKNWLQGNLNKDNMPRWSYIQLQLPKGDLLSRPKLFYANQAAIQINPNQIFVFGGMDSQLRGTTESYLISIQQINANSRQVGLSKDRKQYRYVIRWVNQKCLISGDDFRGVYPIINHNKLYTFQSIGRGNSISSQKRLLQFNMYQWFQTQNILPQ